MTAPLIAVVEDDQEICGMLDDLLTMEGYRVLLYHQGKDAHVVLRRARPDLIILDLWLETEAGGETVLGLLELDPATRHIPVIVCSGHISVLKDKAAQFRQRGYAVVPKPFQIDELLTAIEARVGPAEPAALERGG